MADSATQLRRVVGRLRARGFTVVEVPGWETRGAGAMTTRGRVEHHTAGARTGDAPSLRVVTFGREGLRNSLSRWFVSRSGIIHLIALRTSWHAGAGAKGSNSTLSGTEAENTGTGETWGARSLDAQAAISEEECREFGLTAGNVWEDKEHAPARKIDRHGLDGAAWRRRLDTALASVRPHDRRYTMMLYCLPREGLPDALAMLTAHAAAPKGVITMDRSEAVAALKRGEKVYAIGGPACDDLPEAIPVRGAHAPDTGIRALDSARSGWKV